MGLGRAWDQLKLLLDFRRAARHAEDLMAIGKLGKTLLWFSGAFAALFVAEVVRRCPDLVTQLPTIIGATVVACVSFWLKVPKTAKDLGLKALFIGGLSAGWVVLQQAFGEACPAIVENWWSFFLAVATAGVNLFIRGPQEAR